MILGLAKSTKLAIWLRICARMVILLLLATIRSCFFLVEQPLSSVMWALPYIKYLKKVISEYIPWQYITLPGA